MYMAKIYETARKSTLALRQRKRFLVSQLKIFPDCLRASLVELLKVARPTVTATRAATNTAPFYYLTQCPGGRQNQ